MVNDETILDLGGVRVGLIGFRPHDAGNLAESLAGVGGVSRVIVPEESCWDGCDVLAVCPDLVDLVQNLTKLVATPLPWVLVGPPQTIHDNSILHLRADEIVIAPHSAEEFLFRVHRALRRRAFAMPEERDRRNATVLVADDDPSVTALLNSILHGYGLECFCASNGREAVEKTRELLPDVLLLDINMPGMDGLDVLRWIRRDAATRNIKVLLLSGYGDPEHIEAGSSLGADGYLVKPVDHFLVTRRVKSLLAESAPSLMSAGHAA